MLRNITAVSSLTPGIRRSTFQGKKKHHSLNWPWFTSHARHLPGYLLCLVPAVSPTRWGTRGLIPPILQQLQKFKPAENQSCSVADQQPSELCHPPRSGALTGELSSVVFACQAHDESLWAKSFLWCRHVTSFKANESYVHALRAEYFMPWRRSLRKKKPTKNHTLLWTLELLHLGA